MFPCTEETFNHFNDETFLGEFSTSSFKVGQRGILEDVSKYVERGAEIYLHSYYIMTVDNVVDEDLSITEKYYWFKIGLKKK